VVWILVFWLPSLVVPFFCSGLVSAFLTSFLVSTTASFFSEIFWDLFCEIVAALFSLASLFL